MVNIYIYIRWFLDFSPSRLTMSGIGGRERVVGGSHEVVNQPGTRAYLVYHSIQVRILKLSNFSLWTVTQIEMLGPRVLIIGWFAMVGQGGVLRTSVSNCFVCRNIVYQICPHLGLSIGSERESCCPLGLLEKEQNCPRRGAGTCFPVVIVAQNSAATLVALIWSSHLLRDSPRGTPKPCGFCHLATERLWLE